MPIPSRAPAETCADQRAQRERHRAKGALLHEPGLQRNGDRHQRRHRVRQDVGIGQHLGRLPPAQPAIRRVIERCDERELERHEQVAAGRASQHRSRRAARGRPHAPQLRLVRERAPREALRRHEHERVRQPAAERDRRRRAGLARPERRRRLRGVEVEPGGRRRGQRRRRHQAADDESGDERGTHGEPVRSREPQHAEDAAAEAVEQPGRQAGDPGDRVVRAAQLAEPALERLRDVHVRRDLGQLVAGDREPQADARLAELFRALVDERVVDASGGPRLLRLLRAGDTARGRPSSPPPPASSASASAAAAESAFVAASRT